MKLALNLHFKDDTLKLYFYLKAVMFEHYSYLVNSYVSSLNLFQDITPHNAKIISFLFSYAKKAKELSQIYHDRPTPPGAELVHWVEHVIKTGGAPHLRSPALQVPFYQKLYLDLAALILIVVIALRFIVKRVWKLCSKKTVDSKKKNK